MKKLFFGIFLAFSLNAIAQKIPAFPGAEGAGAYATGGRGGDIYHVTNLNNSGTGSLRDAISTAPTQGRTIVFDISGDIKLTSTLNITKPNLTIAGQTAPSKGICIKDYRAAIDASNIIIRHIRFRPSEIGGDGDAFSIKSGHNIMIDHCSVSWSSDEVMSTSNNPIDSVSIQWTYIYEGLDISYHYENGILIDHSMGSLFTSTLDKAIFSIHHCLYAHNRTRNPKPTTTLSGNVLFFDFRNNVIYDWGDKAGYSSDDPTRYVEMNYVANYLIAGPSTKESGRGKAFNAESSSITIFQEGNKIDANLNGIFDGSDTGWGMFTGPYNIHATPYNFPSITTESADSALVHVLHRVGAFPWNRDIADARIEYEVRNATGKIIDAVTEVGGYETLLQVIRPSGYDTDQDGMPDAWETQRGLSPTNPADASTDRNTDGYSNLEEYLSDAADQFNSNTTAVHNPTISSIRLFPIPCREQLTLQMESEKQQWIELCIMDITGKKVLDFGKRWVSLGENKWLLVTEELTKGIYFLQLGGDIHQSVQLIVQ